MTDAPTVRFVESLRIKIGEAKNLPTSVKDTYVTVRLDQEAIFATRTVEKSTNPFYGEEFSFDVPKKFRSLSCYIHEKGHKQDKVVGKVALRKAALTRHHGRDHWFPLVAVDQDSEVQGQCQLDISFDARTPGSKQRLQLKVTEAKDLAVVNGSCNPYALISLRGPGRVRDDVKQTAAKRKTANPCFDETFIFDFDKKVQSTNNNDSEELRDHEISIQLWHDDSRMSREMFGSSMFPGTFLGEVRLPVKSLPRAHRGWYFLQPREPRGEPREEPGSVRLRIHYTPDHVFPADTYRELRDLLLHSADSQVAGVTEEVARPIVRLFYQHGKIVDLIRTLASWEISNTSDANTLFRGNTLVCRCIDELMKLVGMHYLQDTLKEALDMIFESKRPTEIDPTRIKDTENMEANLSNLERYVESVFHSITNSAPFCPPILCEVFYALKEAALTHFPDNHALRHHVVSGFVFLRFFAPAILGPRLFQLRLDIPDAATHRTLTLVSKAIQSLGNCVSASKTLAFKEEYMKPLTLKFTDDHLHSEAIKQFLDIISSLTKMQSKSVIDTPITLKEGVLTKRAQGRRKLGRKNFKKRYFCLTNQSLSYSKQQGQQFLCNIPLQNILGVEDLQEESFTRKYMFQVIQPNRALYIQTSNCVEHKEWKDVLNKVCQMNKQRLQYYHPAAYLKGRWQCCHLADANYRGCTPVSGASPVEIEIQVDEARELERVHVLFEQAADKVDQLTALCSTDCRVVQADTDVTPSSSAQSLCSLVVEDRESCGRTLRDLAKVNGTLAALHRQHVERQKKSIVIGSQEMPFGSCDGEHTHL